MELEILYGKVFKDNKIVGKVKVGDYGVEDVDTIACTIIIDEEIL